MKVNINGIIVRDLECFSYNGCELSFRFSENHSYIIAEFLQLMNELFNGSCRYFYRGHLDEDIEKEEIAITRQKVNSLTLKKERLLTDRKMQRLYGEQQEVDKLNQQIKKVNSKIKELQNTMPTDSLKKQVVAIYR